MDEGNFTVSSLEIEQSKGIRGRAAVGKQNVVIMTESIPLEGLDNNKKER